MPTRGCSPRVPPSQGWTGSTRFQCLLNPHGENRGAIESYFLPQIRRTKEWSCIEGLLQCYAERTPSTVLREKMIVRTFIAHKNGHNSGLNAAFNAKILTCDDDSLDAVRRFVSLLRNASPSEDSGNQPRQR